MSTVQAQKRLPPLENGDRLTRAEFERRYEAMPHVKKAELIDGEVFMGSPVSWKYHAGQHTDLNTWLGTYRAVTPGTDAVDNATVRLDSKNEPQPDVALIVRPEYGGQVRKSGEYIEGTPDLVAEVSASTASIDLDRKLDVYRRNQVREYIVWRTYDEQLDWLVLRDEKFVRLEPDTDGLLKSVVFPGLWLDPTALMSRDLAKVLAALACGTASPEHAVFVQKLTAQAGMQCLKCGQSARPVIAYFCMLCYSLTHGGQLRSWEMQRQSQRSVGICGSRRMRSRSWDDFASPCQETAIRHLEDASDVL